MSGKVPVLVGVLLGAALLWGGNPVAAATPGAGGSVTISAVVAPVRYILVDNHDAIRQIQSNGSANVAPVVYRGSFKSVPINLTPNISRQYTAIMALTDTRHSGVIYQAQGAPTSKLGGFFGWLHLSRG